MFKWMGKKIMTFYAQKIIENQMTTKTYVVGTQKTRLDETVPLSTLNICLNW